MSKNILATKTKCLMLVITQLIESTITIQTTYSLEK